VGSQSNVLPNTLPALPGSMIAGTSAPKDKKNEARFGRLAFTLSVALTAATNLDVPVRASEDSLTTAPDRPGFGDSTSVTPVGHLELELGYHFAFFDHEGTESRMHTIPASCD
jgi:hypothetical protein